MSVKKVSEHGPIRAFLGEGTEFEGLLAFEGTVRVDGRFNGEIQTDDCLIIGENATVKAEVNVGHLIVMGKLIGNVHAVNKVEITASGFVEGDIHTPGIVVQEGAILRGGVRMEKDAGKKENVVKLKEVRSEASGGK
ncbi:MAG: hypothetical protein IEMM0002_0360 [bacterium]|nr:MAG: hypothetical protein IEMM0002_0360 [bacterium]